MNRLGLVSCLLAVGACKGGGDDSFNDVQAVAAGDALGASVESSAQMFGPVAQTTANSQCVTLTGDLTDDDADSIPVNATLTYACTDTFLGLTGMLTGTMAVTDDDPAAAAWKFTGTAALHASLAATNGASITSDRDGTLTATQSGATFGLAHDLDVVTVFEGTRDNPATTTVTETAGWTLSFMPTITWTPGGVIVDGSLDASGSWSVTVGNAAADATLATPTPLTLSPLCDTRVTGGTVTASFTDAAGASRTITVSWTACGQHTVQST